MSASTITKGIHIVSKEIGILNQMMKLPRMNNDPLMINYGIEAANTQFLSGEQYGGKSAGCGFTWGDAILGTIGESLERYAAAFYDISECTISSFNNLNKKSIHPKEFALFHDEQFKDERFKMNKFDENIELAWFPSMDLTNGKQTLIPGQFIYLPFTHDKGFITANTSTGLASHTNYYKAILNGLYEAIERDSFAITWLQNIVPDKIIISKEIENYINEHFPCKYDWHFFNITYDINVPTVLGFCFGESEYGKFIAVGSSARATYGEAIQKTIQEIGQGIPFFRYLLNDDNKSVPSNDFTKIQDFDQHAIFYTKRPDLAHIFNKWRNAIESKSIDLNEPTSRCDKKQIKFITQIMKDKEYNVCVKDITTHDVNQLGFYSLKVFIPQLIQLSGAYPFYFLGGERLYSVPLKMNYPSNDFHGLNKFPHPFP